MGKTTWLFKEWVGKDWIAGNISVVSRFPDDGVAANYFATNKSNHDCKSYVVLADLEWGHSSSLKILSSGLGFTFWNKAEQSMKMVERRKGGREERETWDPDQTAGGSQPIPCCNPYHILREENGVSSTVYSQFNKSSSLEWTAVAFQTTLFRSRQGRGRKFGLPGAPTADVFLTIDSWQFPPLFKMYLFLLSVVMKLCSNIDLKPFLKERKEKKGERDRERLWANKWPM